MREKVEQEIAELEYLDLIEVKWLDASRFRNAKIGKITNQVFATYKKVVGWFLAVKLEKLYREPYMVIITERTNGRIDLVNIPLKVIMNVTRMSERGYRKEFGDAGSPYLQGGYVSKYRIVEGGVGTPDEEAEASVNRERL